MTPEGLVKNHIKKYLGALPNCYWFMPVGTGWGTGGIPDIIVCYKGLFIGLETKAPGKEKNVTPLQRMQLDKINHAHGHGRVVSSVAEVRQLIAAIDFLNPLRT